MHDATTPPLITYEANYKRRSSSSGAYTHRKERFTDVEYNRVAEMAESVEDATLYPRKGFRINTARTNEGELGRAVKKIVNPGSVLYSSRGFITLVFPSQKARDAARTKVEKIIEKGPITYYDSSNPLYAYTADGTRVEGITESYNYGNTVYETNGNSGENSGGNSGTPTGESYSGTTGEGYRYSTDVENAIAAQSEDEKKEKKKKIIIISIIGVAIVGFVVLAILKKKGKI